MNAMIVEESSDSSGEQNRFGEQKIDEISKVKPSNKESSASNRSGQPFDIDIHKSLENMEAAEAQKSQRQRDDKKKIDLIVAN